MTTNHIDQLAQWWENAEEGPVGKGDLVIKRHPDGRYTIREAEKGWETTNYRILSRAPKPKPAWHDAVAVIAHTDYCERQVWERESDGTYSGSAGDVAGDRDLRDVTPLVEAKVTDEATQRVFNAFKLAHTEHRATQDIHRTSTNGGEPMSSTFSIETHGGYQQTGEEAARMHARVHYGHDNFRFVSKELTSTNEIRNGAWQLIRVQPIYTYTFEANK